VIDWIIAGALTAVLLAEVVDAWALRQLTARCLRIEPRTREEQRLVRWYAEGFDHSIAVTSWLAYGCIALTAVASLAGAQPAVLAVGALLSVAAMAESHLGTRLRRRFLQRPLVTTAYAATATRSGCDRQARRLASRVVRRRQVPAEMLLGPAQGSAHRAGGNEAHVAAADG